MRALFVVAIQAGNLEIVWVVPRPSLRNINDVV